MAGKKFILFITFILLLGSGLYSRSKVKALKNSCTPTTSTTNVTICIGQTPYSWNGNTYNNSGTYTKLLTNAAGCDSIANLNLNINAVVSSATNAIICSSLLPYIWNGNSYNAAGTYNVLLHGFAGCDSIATIVLKVIPNSGSTTNKSICFSALPYIWNGDVYDATGVYSKAFTNASGCDSIAVLNLTVNQIDSSVTNTGICTSALPYTWNGNTYSTAGTYLKKLTGATGCDSFATLILTINPINTSTTDVSLCPLAFPYIWNGNSYSTAGMYSKTLKSAKGCDSIADLNLTNKVPGTSYTRVNRCPPELPYFWNGVAYNATGVYTKTFSNASGCDSIATLNLAVTNTLSSTVNIIICPLQLPYSWNGNSYSAAGTYITTLQNYVGCDSIITLNLKVVSILTSTNDNAVCASQLPYIWNGISYTTSGTYTKAFKTAAGCDSVATLNLTVFPAVVNSITTANICQSSLPYIWNDNFFTISGTYKDSLQNATGCDSVATVILNVNPNTVGVITANICSSDLPYTWNGNEYNANGIYLKTLTNVAGCDSISILNLSINKDDSTILTANICLAQVPYIWNGTSYNTSGLYTKTLTNVTGCDSIVKLNLTVNAVIISTSKITLCQSQLPYIWNGNTYNTGGIYNVALKGQAGCDSIATLNLKVTKTVNDTAIISVCPSALPYVWNGNSYNATGIYIKTFTLANGCDSNAVLNFIVNTTLRSTTNINICPAQLPYSWNANIYSTGGTYTKTLTNAEGCDSVAVLNLIVSAVVNSLDNESVCGSALPYSWNGSSYNTAGTYSKKLSNAAGCDSVAVLILVVNPNTSSTNNISVCVSALPYTWNGNSFSMPGTYTKKLINANGCDSVATLVLSVKQTSGSITNISVCASALPYSWNGNFYTIAGTYTKTLANAAGCDSTATLHLFINNSATTITEVTICPAVLPYIWNGNSYSAAGLYTKMFLNVAGCDSIATLNLSVNTVRSSTTSISVCASALPYIWNGNSYSVEGTYTKSFSNISGCDSIATLTLSITTATSGTSNVNVCSSSLPYVWNGNSYNTSGTYIKTLINTGGCDSVATLNLTVSTISSSATNIIICQSALPYLWNGNSYTAAGTYTKILMNAGGCDSVSTLNLQVVTAFTSTTNTSVCKNDLPYVWNGNSYNVAGTYHTLLLTSSGCDSVATLLLSTPILQPVPSLGKDTSLCPNTTLILSPGIYNTYLWQDLSNTPSFTVSHAGNYIVTVSDSQGCTDSANVEVTYLPNCDALYFANAITPNGDGVNDYFGALGNLNFVSKYSLSVYNRFGVLVFSTSNPSQKWNGIYKGNPVDPDTFVWYSAYTFKGKNKIQKGYVVVIR